LKLIWFDNQLRRREMMKWLRLSWKGSSWLDSLVFQVGQLAQEFVGRQDSFRSALEVSAVEFGFEESLLLSRVARSLEVSFVETVASDCLLFQLYNQFEERFSAQSSWPYECEQMGSLVLCYDPPEVRWLPEGFRVALISAAEFKRCTMLYDEWRNNVQQREVAPEPQSIPPEVARAEPSYSLTHEGDEVSEIKSEYCNGSSNYSSVVSIDQQAALPIVKQIDVLALEDDRVFANILARFFEREGLEAEVVHTVEALQARLHSGVLPRVIVSDVHLQESNGLDMLLTLPQPAPPVVMLTSDNSFNTEVEAIHRGARAFLSKERDPRLLAAYVKSIAREQGAMPNHNKVAA
jgi:ActR/RegA family two-component response regulator